VQQLLVQAILELAVALEAVLQVMLQAVMAVLAVAVLVQAAQAAQEFFIFSTKEHQ
jgi:hypothetical protein